MKILQVTNFFKPSWESGGVTRSAYEISKHLVEQGNDVTVYTTDGYKKRLDVKKNKAVSVDGVRTYYFRNLSNYLSRNFLITTPYLLSFVAKEEMDRFDVIHIHEHRTMLAVIVSYYAKKYNVPYIIQPRGSAQKINKSFQKSIFDNIFGFKILNGSMKLILSSKNEYKLSESVIKKSGIKQGKIAYIPNGVNMETKKFEVERFRDENNIKNEEKIILYLGRIHERKGLRSLLEAFEMLNEEQTDLKLVIAGPDDGYKAELRKLISDFNIENDVMLFNGLYGEEKISAFNAADVFVLPSLDEQESFGNVVLEASAFGTPCVVTNVCGVSEYMDNIIKVNPDIDSIKEGIEKALQMKKLGKNARKEVLKKFSWEKITKTIETTYDEIISNA